ncbi:MAG: UDP-N-acetylmuramoyl-L-alanine--D-glutamate ligase [Clostridia bacterium]|nr:UDP-N-acetylmuramoyl-L-alanine--D-glutamate ligase [Clostridia bacterium]
MFENKDLEEFKHYIKGKYVAVIGMGVSNTPLIRYLMDLDANITVFDRKTEDELDSSLCEEYALQGVKFSLGENYLDNLNGYDIIFRSPSMRPDHPALEHELNRGAILTSEIEMLIDLCPGKIIGITGSDGKTTTTTLIYKILVEDGYHCYLGGNIGTPLFARIDEMKPEDIVVLELSSFQLMTLKKSPHISIVTNVSPNHLDVHKSYEEYIESKENIFKYQKQGDIVVLNFDNDITREMANLAKGDVRFFSTKVKLDDGVILDSGMIKVSTGKVRKQIIKTDDILLMGAHNIENACTAIAAIHDIVKPTSIVNVLKTFKGVEHRNEFVRELDGAKWYNDSIGSSPTRTIAGLLSFNQKVILIAGGYDKHLDYTNLGKYIVDHVSTLILLGQTKEKIKNATLAEIESRAEDIELPFIECETLEEAVNCARKCAKKGDIVFFSPASASFDMFKNFMERGNKFKELVNNL